MSGRYSDLKIINNRFVATRYRPKANTYGSTITIEVSADTRLDKLAMDFYGDGALWWRIADANGIGFFFDYKARQTLVIPLDYNPE